MNKGKNFLINDWEANTLLDVYHSKLNYPINLPEKESKLRIRKWQRFLKLPWKEVDCRRTTLLSEEAEILCEHLMCCIYIHDVPEGEYKWANYYSDRLYDLDFENFFGEEKFWNKFEKVRKEIDAESAENDTHFTVPLSDDEVMREQEVWNTMLSYDEQQYNKALNAQKNEKNK